MSDYIGLNPKVADRVYEQQEELRSAHQRLESLSDQDLQQMLSTSSNPTLRIIALSILLRRTAEAAKASREQRDSTVAELLGDLIEDSQVDIARFALRHCPLNSADNIDKARQMLSSPDDQVRAAAAVALASIKDESLLPICLDWFRGDDMISRNIAIESVKTLASEEAANELRTSFENGGRDEKDRAVLAIALLGMGDTTGLEFLRLVAQRANGPYSVMAATSIFSAHEPDEGLRLMRDILDKGDLDAKRSLVIQICHSWLRSAHAFTADGIHEARVWIERKLESSD